MSRWNVIITAVDGCASTAEQLHRRLESAWQCTTALSIKTTTLDGLTSDNLKRNDLVILIATGLVERGAMTKTLSAIEESGNALIGLMDKSIGIHTDVQYAGGLMLPIDTPDHTLCATAFGLLHRQRELRQLNQELSVAQRFHGGLEGEIARMHEELQLAAMVQREMLPRKIPALRGVTFAAMWRPANYVSGDIYDICQFDDEHIGVFITDAVGHGVPAALMTMIISRSLITTEREGEQTRILPPSQVLARLNVELLLRQGRTTRFATGIYAVINCKTRRCTLAGAGHPPPLLLRADGTQQLLETNGGLLGVFADETYDQIEIDLQEGDRMLLYSDGFEQAFPNADADVYEQRLPTTHYREEFEKLAKLDDPVQVVNQMRERLDAQRGSLHQIDDLTLICMCIGKAEPTTLKHTIDRALSGDAPRTAATPDGTSINHSNPSPSQSRS